jgi:hypothetical protein
MMFSASILLQFNLLSGLGLHCREELINVFMGVTYNQEAEDDHQLGPEWLWVMEEVLPCGMINETTQAQHVAVSEMHPTLGKGMMARQGDGVCHKSPIAPLIWLMPLTCLINSDSSILSQST